MDRLREAHPVFGTVASEDPSVASNQVIDVAVERFCAHAEKPFSNTLGGGLRRIAGHEGHARRIAAEINRRQVGVCRRQLDVFEVYAEYLGDDRGEDVVRALADVDGAAQERDSAIAIELELDLRVRHVVPVDRGARPAQVGADGEAQPAASRHRGTAFQEPRFLDDPVDALLQPAARDPQPVDRARIRLGQVASPDFYRIKTQLFGHLVKMRLEREARLRGTVPTLGTAGRLVGEQPDALEAITRDRIGRRLQRAGVIGAGDPVAAVSAAIEKTLELHRVDPTVLLEAGLHLHQDGMPAAMRVEHFLASQCDLHRPPGHHRQLGGDQLVREDVALAAEAAAVRRGDHADPAHWQLEHLS